MGMNLILEFKLHRGDISQIRWARRIKFDGDGGLIIFDQENATTERLQLNRLQDLRIQALPAWAQNLAYHA